MVFGAKLKRKPMLVKMLFQILLVNFLKEIKQLIKKRGALTLNEVIDNLSSLTGKEVSQEKRKKIIDKIVNDKVPKNVDKMF